MDQRLYVFVHLYKTAGQTLRHNFQKNFAGDAWLPMYAGPIGLDKRETGANPGWRSDRVQDYVRQRANVHTQCIFGHMAYYGVHELAPGKRSPFYVTFLRHPLDRLISLYHYLKFRSDNAWHDEIAGNDWSIEEWIGQSAGLWLYNGQLRHLLLHRRPELAEHKEMTAAHVEEGKQILREFGFVGLTEFFAQDSYYLYGLLHFKRFHPEDVVNASPGNKRISHTAAERIMAENPLDLQLYEFARDLRQQFVRQHLLHYRFNMIWAQLRRSMVQRRGAALLPVRS